MGLLALLAVVLAITATALLAKYAARRGVPSLDLSTSLFGFGALLGGIVLWREGAPGVTTHAFVVASLAGVGGALAVWTFNSAVRAGHFGFSNAIYRSAFLLPVVFSVLFLGVPLDRLKAAGIACILAGVFLMSQAGAPGTGNSGEKPKARGRWIVLILLAFLFSGGPRIGQLLTSAARDNGFVYLFLSYLAGALVLLALLVRRGGFHLEALPWGAGAAAASYAGVFCTLEALRTLTPHVVYPISLSAPIVLGLACSRGLFRERIAPRGALGALLAIAGILILALGK
ncbi:MAG: EamA family transporter [Chthoniobacteraceae bacterium]|nr:EamA family transporter [Chthoniobacteraceae bacterium]